MSRFKWCQRREQLERIDLRWHDLRHEGACCLLADDVDIRIIQLCSDSVAAPSVLKEWKRKAPKFGHDLGQRLAVARAVPRGNDFQAML